MDERHIIYKLTKLINPKRLEHSLGVKETAEKLAHIHGVDKCKASIAGLLHDCAKNFSPLELIEKSREYGIRLDEVSLNQTGLIHGPLGAKVAEDIFEIKDPDILSAIEYHIYGREDMTKLEKLIYLADLTEPGRTFKGVEELRLLSEKNIDEAMIKALGDSTILLISGGKLVHPNALKALNSLLIKKLKYKEGIC